MAKKEISTIKVKNTEIVLGQTYEVIGKKDYDAPNGFQEHGTTKLLMKGISEIHSVPFSVTNNLWNSGFYEHAECNRSIKEAEKKALVSLYKKEIQLPFENLFNVNTSESNNDFWNEYMYEIYTNKSFDTSKPKDLFDLFHALQQGVICEVGEKDPTLQRTAKYCIRNIEKAISLQEEKTFNKAEAVSTFTAMLKAADFKKDDTLYTILEWMNISNIRGADKETVKRTVLKTFENTKNGYESCLRFLEAYNLSESENGKKEMEIFSVLNKLKNKRVLEFRKQQFYLDDELLGNNLKAVAKSALNNPDKYNKIITAYEKLI